MSSYPYQRIPMPSSQYYHPSWDFTPPQVKEDRTASGPSFMYESWPQNCGYSVPMQCPNCSNHAQNSPAFNNFRPPCPHSSSPQLAYSHFCGGYPPYPQPSYPISCVPPPHYTMELPRYEYDKKAQGGFRCCGCPNHQCHLKEGKNVRIEDHEPEVETTKSESLVPAGLNNFTQPILWIPPGYVINKEQQHQQQQPRRVENEADKQHVSPYYYIKKPQGQRRPIEVEAEEQREPPQAKKLQLQQRPIESEEGEHIETPRVKKPQQSVKTDGQEPDVRYGWFPLDMNNIRELLGGGQGSKGRDRVSKGVDGENAEDVENKEQHKQFPFPIIWVPYGGQGENDAKGQEEKYAGEAPSKVASPTFKVIPMKLEHPDIEPEKIKTTVGDDGSGVRKRATAKTSSLKTIPVKQLEEPVPKPMKKDEDLKEEGAAVKTAERNGNGHSSSPTTKKSKLPPICLRVDPPKKKNANGSSRSPSPPVDKKWHEPEESKTVSSKKEIKVSEAEVKPPSQSKIEVSRKVAGEEKREKHEGDSKIKGEEGQESQGAKESKPQEAKKPKRRILSEQEAATIIQSAYRGYDVRRWEPLKKLRQIAKIREEAGEVKKHIHDLASRSGSSINEREKAIVAETIMKLLLKLDTIQGLHPSFRDVRRSVAKELTVLQEKIDSIINKKSAPVDQENPTVEEPPKVSSQDEGSTGVTETAEEPSKISTQLEGSYVVKTVKDPSCISGLDESSRDIGEIAEEPSKESSQVESSKGEDKNAEVCKEDEVPKFDEVSSVQPLVVGGFGKEETLETSEVKVESQNEPQDESARNSPVPTVADSGTDMKEAANSDGSEAVQGKLAAESQDLSAGIANTVEQADFPSGHKEEHINLLAEVPLEIVEDDKNESSQVEVNSGIAVREESIERAPSAPTCEVESEREQRDEESNLQVEIELPQEVIEDGAKEQTSEFPSSETLNIDQEEDQSAGDVKDEATQAIEPESCKPEPSELLSINEAQKVLESEPLEIAIPISEHNDHMPEKPAVEKAAHVEESDPQVSEVRGGLLKPEEDEETKLISHADRIELNSIMASRENQVSHDEDAHEFIGVVDQERTSEERDSVIDQPTVPAPENLKGQTIGSETEASQIETQQPKREGVPSKEQPKEGGQDEEEQIDKRVMEENQKLREMVERLIASGKEQQDVISSLSGKLKDLEKKLARKNNKTKSTKRPRVRVSRASCGKPSNGSLREKPMGVKL